jgi:hypothetical protein
LCWCPIATKSAVHFYCSTAAGIQWSDKGLKVCLRILPYFLSKLFMICAINIYIIYLYINWQNA